MMEPPPLTTDLVIADVLARWPQTVSVFLRHHMICVGCAMSRFETLGEIASVYDLDLNVLLRELRQVIGTA
jgi:hybrid cluster-associated redox disulfide protein